jgi:hypothetical protein
MIINIYDCFDNETDIERRKILILWDVYNLKNSQGSTSGVVLAKLMVTFKPKGIDGIADKAHSIFNVITKIRLKLTYKTNLFITPYF